MYLPCNNGIIIHTGTGFEWIAVPGRDRTWDEARDCVRSLVLDGGGWRFPTVRELKGLYRPNAGPRNMIPLLKTSGWQVDTPLGISYTPLFVERVVGFHKPTGYVEGIHSHPPSPLIFGPQRRTI